MKLHQKFVGTERELESQAGERTGNLDDISHQLEAAKSEIEMVNQQKQILKYRNPTTELDPSNNDEDIYEER